LNAGLLQGFYLSDLLIEPTKGRVTGREGSEHLASKAIEVLLCLASQPGELVSREELLEKVWGKDEGSPEALSHAIGEIRHALRDHHDDPKYIQTLPKRGYRLLVTPVAADGATGTIVMGATNSVSADELGLFENLKQRGVLETGLAYLILGWLLIQIADIVFAQLFVPQWVGTFVTVLVIAGFPIAIGLSWFLEFRDGRAVVHELSPRDTRKRRFSRTYMSVIGALGIAAGLVFIYDKSVGLPEEVTIVSTVVAEEPALPPVLENSIAVLPFVNIDGSEETQVFADGLVDDVITRLSRVPGLLVASRGDAYTLKPNSSSDHVRRRLRVAMYLEGSVQIEGDVIRIIVQMIDSTSGFHIQSRTFDRPRDSFFSIRDEITALTVSSLRVALPEETQARSSPISGNPTLDAYVLYRRGVDESRKPQTPATIASALGWFDAALDVDPDYAAAHAGKCGVLADGYRDFDDPIYMSNAEIACAQALQLNANLDVVHSALGDLYRLTGRYDESEASYLEALRINSISVVSLTGLSDVYRLQRRPDEAEQVLRQAIGLQPGNWRPYNFLGYFFYRQGQFLEAAEQFANVVAIDDRNMRGHANMAASLMMAGDFAAAAPAYQRAINIEPQASTYGNLGLMYYYLGQYDEAVGALRNALELAPKSHLTWSNLGDVLSVASRNNEAMDAFRQAETYASAKLAVNPNDPAVMMDMAWIRAMLGDESEAMSIIGRAVSLSPDDPYGDYIQALILSHYNQDDAALDSLTTAAEKGYSLIVMAAEPKLAALREHPRFTKVVTEELD
jgi:TolB-like protein/tetratricopeptide (TPR) repeat protein/DNA-binding winged helix-turn-helix (wHTH) protein